MKERRKYIRLNKIFPVELQIIDDKNKPRSELLQGFTRDVSFNGLCVEINDFKQEYISLLQKTQAKIVAYVNIPLRRNPVKAVARLAWAKKTIAPYPRSYLLGIEYEVIDKAGQEQIIGYVNFNKAVSWLIKAFCVLLVLFCGYLVFENMRLVRNNKLLVQELGSLSDEQFRIKTQIDKMEEEKLSVTRILDDGRLRSESLKQQLVLLEERKLKKIQESNFMQVNKLIQEKQKLERQLQQLLQEKVQMEEKLKRYTQSQENLKTRLTEIDNKKTILEDRSLDLMHQWLISAQSRKTGLVRSYDNDMALMDLGFTYDQALSAFNFIYFQEYERAKMIFDFFKNRAQKVDRGFANAYDVITGGVTEYITHSGPSIYLAMAMLKYEEVTKDGTYNMLAQEIGQWLLSLQEKREDGALPGGPQVEWVSTEQNIAAYVFFNRIFYKTKDERYAIAAREVLTWLKTSGYNEKLKRFNRGVDDKMIATDTVALSIMAFGPEGLKDMGINVDDLIKCIEENCKTRVSFESISGRRVNVTGYDFCSPSSLGRAGVISVEWTAQMIVAYQLLNRFYLNQGKHARAKGYQRQADYYEGELEKLLLVRSPFGKRKGNAGFPYATDTGTDTGHGWSTPDHNSISASGTNFAIFAKEAYNIF